MKKTVVTRRKALAGLGSLQAASPWFADHPPLISEFSWTLSRARGIS